jgi:xylulose-5-phosphate/fructose-6-phosphate phosphoketolase
MALMFEENELKSIEEVKKTQQDVLELLKIYQRAANYLAGAQIYLKSNVLLRGPLQIDDIKPRLLGHWGTCPGINLIYAHLNRLILQYDCSMFLVTGPGHGAPANLANLYLEGSLQEFYPLLTQDEKGLQKFIRDFSWPDGFPSHLYPGLPGTIHEGGELGYALATAYGASMDNPDLIVACIVGDGEAETGPTAGAWHSPKFIDPAESGAVLPIVHINGYKISSPTIYGTMDDNELQDLFLGYGYQPCFVAGPDLDASMLSAMDWAYHQIHSIQQAARQGNPISKPRWPVILFRSPKGMGGIKELHGQKIEGTYRAHQVPAKDVRTNPEELKQLEQWLNSYRPDELFDQNGKPIDKIKSLCPKGDKRMGMNPQAFGGRIRQDLKLRDIKDYQIHLNKQKEERIIRGDKKASNVQSLVPLLSDIIQQNPHTFRIFSPDELESNKLNVFGVTHRDYQWPLHPYDTYIGSKNGRVIEVLSEHNCQGWMQGYTLTGRYALFPSYEAFLGIVTTMVDQYAKFIKMSKEFPWRLPVPSLNYIATSTLWRQEHNGFSHQNPGFVNTLLNKKGETVRIYLPPDANCLISTMDHCLRSKNYVNLIIASKQETPQWLTMDEAVEHCRAGASIWRWASTDQGINPDVVLVGLGDDTMLEVMAAVSILLHEVPELRIRVVNVTDLLVLEDDSLHPHGLEQSMFDALFTPDKSVIFNFHGYPSALQQLLFHRGDTERFLINGYKEEGTTTTPFDMMVRNEASRFHIIMQAIRLAIPYNPKVAALATEKISYYKYQLRDHHRYIKEYGEDPKEITEWKWSPP